MQDNEQITEHEEIGNNEPVKKDGVEFHFEQMRQTALLSPLINNNVDPINFVKFYDYNNNYHLAIGLMVIYVDSERYKHDYGAFYPYWVIQAAFLSKASKQPVKFNLLPTAQRQVIPAFVKNLMKDYGNHKEILKSLTATDAEYRLPFTDADILLLDEVFQSLIRKNNTGENKNGN